MSSLRIDFDYARWLEIPARFPFGEFTAPAEWASGVAHEIQALQSKTTSLQEILAPLLELVSLTDEEAGVVYLGFLVGVEPPAAVVTVALREVQIEFKEQFRTLYPPTVDEIRTSSLGTGYRSLRTCAESSEATDSGRGMTDIIESSDSLFISIRYEWLIRGERVLLGLDTPDIELGLAMIPFMDELANGIKIVYDDDEIIETVEVATALETGS